MLLEFSVENFLSIKERKTFSMFALSDDTSLPDNYFTASAVNGPKVTPVQWFTQWLNI